MADKPIQESIESNLPTNWSWGQIVAPQGEDVGLTKQHGYNYLMQIVNKAFQHIKKINDAFGNLVPTKQVGAANGVASLNAEGRLPDTQTPDKVNNDIKKLETALAGKVRFGTTPPSNDLGVDGDIYIQIEV